jgi:ribosomal protein S18 acetylase RimI-like enzyme
MAPIHRLTATDLPRLRQFWRERWGDEVMIAHGTEFGPENVSGFIALNDNEWIGLVTFVFNESECEIISLDSLTQNEGVGTALVNAVAEEARQLQCHRVFLSTTNDNLRALGFYQKRGFVLSALHPNAVEEIRKRKPGIPLIGENNIPLRDEIELELALTPDPSPK